MEYNTIKGECVHRKQYFEKLLKLKDKQLIKVVTGVRRFEKSTLLEMFRDYLLTNGVDESRVIALNFEEVQNEHILHNSIKHVIFICKIYIVNIRNKRYLIMIVLKKPKIGEQINLLTDIQIEFIKSDRSKINVADFDYLDLKKSVEEDSSFPKEIIFEWEAQEDGILQISESENFDNFFQEIGKSSVKITNLKSGTRYYWRVVCANEISDIFYFDTANTYPRFIKIDGLTNVRDCGGWKTISGKYIKQGQLYRGSEMNSHLSISDDGLNTMKNVLKIKSILDLRGQNEEVKDVYQGLYKNIPAYPYGTWFNHPEIAREIFEFVLNTENYPLYFHCWGGADRTGTLSFMLGAILGQSYKDLFDDYEITSLSIWGARSRNSEGHFKPLLNMFNEFNGETTQEKAENYLISCGVSKMLIKNFQEFMLD